MVILDFPTGPDAVGRSKLTSKRLQAPSAAREPLCGRSLSQVATDDKCSPRVQLKKFARSTDVTSAHHRLRPQWRRNE
jgi:hypothetical protein